MVSPHGEQDNLISVKDAAKECGRNPETVRRWIWSGKLQSEKLGNQLFVKRSALASFCRENEAAPDAVETMTEFFKQALALQTRIKARGAQPVDSTAVMRKMRGERTDGLG